MKTTDILKLDRVQNALNEVLYFMNGTDELEKALRAVRSEGMFLNEDIDDAAKIIKHGIEQEGE